MIFNTTKFKGYRTEFYVTGRGEFPHDMLRYDMCHPAGPDDAANMAAPVEKEFLKWRQIRMVSYTNNGPTVDRWRSFGWTCSPEKLSMSQVG